jgi:hypothetical protein
MFILGIFNIERTTRGAIEAKSPRPILGSSSGISVLAIAGAAGRAVSDDYLSRNRLQISPRFPMPALMPRMVAD